MVEHGLGEPALAPLSSLSHLNVLVGDPAHDRLAVLVFLGFTKFDPILGSRVLTMLFFDPLQLSHHLVPALIIKLEEGNLQSRVQEAVKALTRSLRPYRTLWHWVHMLDDAPGVVQQCTWRCHLYLPQRASAGYVRMVVVGPSHPTPSVFV